VLAAGAAWVAILSRAVATESVETYPVLFPDSFDWLTNALRYTGVPLDVSWRAVLTPFLQAALFAMHAEALIPLLGPCWLVATMLVLVTLGRRLVGDAALYAAVLFAANHHVLAHGLVIGSDMLMVALNTTGLLSTALAVERQEPRWLLLAAPAFALGWLAQPLLRGHSRWPCSSSSLPRACASASPA
jgi:4-amino-4-deoxy-L-arabinose transferase-like glycosyltransferase